MKPLLTILIPTKNRERYLIDILQSINTWKHNNFEVIVHDNSENNVLEELIKPLLEDSRVRYYHVKEWLAGVDNFEKALDLAEGDFVTMIGDDDGIMQEVILAAEWMKQNSVEALLPTRGHYTWPDLEYRYNNDYFNSVLRIDEQFNSTVSKVNPIDELQKVIRAGASTLGDMPRLYYGIVSKKRLDDVKELTGRFFPGPSPDMANAISMSLVVKSFMKIDFPLFISGNCSSSTAGMGAKHLHEGNIEEIPFLPKNCKEEWEPEVPLFWSGPTIWAEAAIKTLKKMKRDSYLKRFNYASLYARCLIFNRNNSSKTYTKIRQNNDFLLYVNIIKHWCYIWSVRLYNLINKRKLFKSKKNGLIEIKEQKSISACIDAFNDHVVTSKQELLLSEIRKGLHK